MERDRLIGLNDKLMPSSEVHPATRKLILGPWKALAEKIGVEPGSKAFAGLAINEMERSRSTVEFGREFSEQKTIPLTIQGGIWVFLSALHKSIRYGLEKEAVVYYRSLVKGGKAALADFYVGNTILFEDVGLADPVLCEVVRQAFCKAAKASEKVRLRLIRLACRANKTRIQSDVLWQDQYPETLTDMLEKAAGLHAEIAAENMIGGKMTVAEAIAFGWVLLGKGATKEYLSNDKAPDRNTELMRRTLTAMDLPEFLRTTCLGALDSKFPFWAVMAVLSCLYAQKWEIDHYSPDAMAVPFEVEKIGEFILPAFDRHNPIGKKAYSEIQKTHPDYFKQTDGMILTMKMFEQDVYRAESEILRNRVGSLSTRHLYNNALNECLHAEGRDPAAAKESVRRLNRNLGPLNEARKKVMGYIA